MWKTPCRDAAPEVINARTWRDLGSWVYSHTWGFPWMGFPKSCMRETPIFLMDDFFSGPLTLIKTMLHRIVWGSQFTQHSTSWKVASAHPQFGLETREKYSCKLQVWWNICVVEFKTKLAITNRLQIPLDANCSLVKSLFSYGFSRAVCENIPIIWDSHVWTCLRSLRKKKALVSALCSPCAESEDALNEKSG